MPVVNVPVVHKPVVNVPVVRMPVPAPAMLATLRNVVRCRCHHSGVHCVDAIETTCVLRCLCSMLVHRFLCACGSIGGVSSPDAVEEGTVPRNVLLYVYPGYLSSSSLHAILCPFFVSSTCSQCWAMSNQHDMVT
eukprot:jgi/Mesvir1/22977/Mv26040-RA.1